MLTRQQRAEVLEHALKTVLGFRADCAIMLSLVDDGYDEIEDVLTMTESEIMAMVYVPDKAAAPDVTKPVPTKERKKLFHLLLWRDWFVSQRTEKTISYADWMALTADSYDEFRANEVANLIRPGSSSTTSTHTSTSGVTSGAVASFDRGHRRDSTAYLAFSGDRKYWFRAKRSWVSQANQDNVGGILRAGYVVPTVGTEAHKLHERQTQYFYSCLSCACKGGQALVLVRTEESTQDGAAVFFKLVDHYERNANLSLMRTECVRELANLRLTSNYPGGPVKFFQHFQNTYLDLEEATRKDVDDAEKIGQLNAAIQDDRFQTVRDTVQTLSLQTGTPVDYSSYLQSLITHAEGIAPSRGNRKQNSAQKHREGGGGNGSSGGDKPWKKDLTAYVPPTEYQKMSQEERKKRFDAKQAKKQVQQRSVNASSNQTLPSTVTTDQAPAPVPAETATVVSEVTEAPSIREIFSARQTQSSMANSLPPGRYTSDTGRQFQVNASRAVRIHQVEATGTAANLCLIDGGSNNGLAGAGMRLFELPEVPDRVDIVGASDSVQDGMRDLPIATYCSVLTSSSGERVLGLFHNYVGYEKGKSILSKVQSEAHGLKVSDRARRHGGQQKVVTPDGFVFKLRYSGGLLYMPMAYPSDADIADLVHVQMSSPTPWNPDLEEDDGDDVLWFDASDTEEESYDEFLDAHDGYVLAQDDVNSYRSLNQAKVSIFGISSAKKPFDYESIRKFFGWRPVEVVKHTIQATTQYAKNVIRLPLRKHYKSRFPALRVPRLFEVYATDTFFSNVAAHDGSTCAQLYVGKQSFFTKIYGMRTESQMPTTLQDFIRSFGAMKGLFSDNAKSETSKAVKDILRQYAIADMQSEPYQQNQNPAERRIQDVKSMTNSILDHSGAPAFLWLKCMIYCCLIFNVMAHQTLNWRTPTEVAFGVTPDVSQVLTAYFYMPVFFYEKDAPYPDSRERSGRIVGFSENVGDALTFEILTDDTQEFIYRSVIRPADDPADPDHNVRVDPPIRGELPSKIAGLKSFADFDTESKPQRLPTIDPETIIGRTFLMEREVDGTVHRAEVTKRIAAMEGEAEQYLVKLGDGTRQDVMTYDAVIEAIDRQLTAEAEKSDEDTIWIFKEVMGHRKVKQVWEVLMKWEDDSETWEPLSAIWKSDPITLAKYARDNDLLETPGWKRLRHYAKNEKKLNRMLKQAKLNSSRTAIRIKFGVKVPMNYRQATQFDAENGNTLWGDAVDKEMDQIYEYETLKSAGKHAPIPRDYTKIRVHLVFDVKSDGRRKARLVAGGHMTGPNNDTYYSSVVSFRAMRMVIFLAELNDLELMAADVGNAYLEAYTREKCAFVAGQEFAKKGHEGHTMIIVRALYGLKTSGARFHEKWADTMREMGFFPSKADQDVWMRDKDDHYEYVCTWVDDLLYAGRDGKGFYDDIRALGYKLKGVEEPKYHLGGDFKRVKEPEEILTWGSHTYVKRMLVNYEQLFGEPVPNREVHAPLEPGDHPELDDSELLDASGIKQYWQMIGEMQWCVALGRIDIISATVTMARFRPAPRRGHLDRLKRVYSFLRNYKKTAIKFNTEMPDYSRYKKVEAPNWGHIYHPCGEELPSDMPPAKGKPVMTTTFVDANLMHDILTGRSCTGIIHLLNKTPIDWFSKRQNQCETATYGSEFVAARTAVDQIVDLRYTLRMLGVQLTGPSWMFGDNLSVVNSSTLPSGKLQKRHNILNFHRVREAQAAGIVNFVHIDGKQNPADICTKHTSSRQWYEVMKPLIFWRWRDDSMGSHQTEGSSNESVLVTHM